MRVLVVDDEPLARDRLIRLLEGNDSVDGTATASNGSEALERLQQDPFDVVLLDIRMPGKSGIEVASAITSFEHPPVVIFCTAYDDYALDAFRVQAQAYLLKPVQRQDLDQALANVSRLNRAQLQALSDSSPIPVILVNSGRDKERVPLNEVYYFRADQKYVSLISERGERVVDESLKVLEERFADQLLRVHRNTLVLKRKVSKLTRDGDGSFHLSLGDLDEPILVSRRHVKAVKQLFADDDSEPSAQ